MNYATGLGILAENLGSTTLILFHAGRNTGEDLLIGTDKVSLVVTNNIWPINDQIVDWMSASMEKAFTMCDDIVLRLRPWFPSNTFSNIHHEISPSWKFLCTQVLFEANSIFSWGLQNDPIKSWYSLDRPHSHQLPFLEVSIATTALKAHWNNNIVSTISRPRNLKGGGLRGCGNPPNHSLCILQRWSWFGEKFFYHN